MNKGKAQILISSSVWSPELLAECWYVVVLGCYECRRRWRTCEAAESSPVVVRHWLMPSYTSHHLFISCAVTFTLCSKVEAAAVHVRRRQVVHKGDSQSNIIYHRKSLPAPMSVHPSSETPDVKLSQPSRKRWQARRVTTPCLCVCVHRRTPELCSRHQCVVPSL